MKHNDETTLVADVFDALNSSTLTLKKAQQRLGRYVQRLPAIGSPDEEELWGVWWDGERLLATFALRDLAKRKRLRPEDVARYKSLRERGVVRDTEYTERVQGRVLMTERRRFIGVDALVAHVLLRLSTMHERIVVCPACGRFELSKGGRGRPPRFCLVCRRTPKHSNRIHQQESRKRKRIKRTGRRKP